MESIDRRTVFAAGLAAASLMSNTSASAQQAAGSSAEARLRELGDRATEGPGTGRKLCASGAVGECDLPGWNRTDQAGW
jgi:hypothetical protein